MRVTVLLLGMVLLLSACPSKTAPPPPGGNAAGMAVGAEFDGRPITIGKGELANKPVVITWFATW